MKIAVISDIHDNVWNLLAALKHIWEAKVNAVICCGDWCSPFIVDLMLKQLVDEKGKNSIPVHGVFGNNDADLYRITTKAIPGRMMFYGELAEFRVVGDQLKPRNDFVDPQTKQDHYFDQDQPDQKRIAVNHFNTIARPLAASGQYDIVFYGHNHLRQHERLGHIDVINPGAIMGYNPLPKAGESPYIDATFVIYDVAAGKPEWFVVKATPGASGLGNYQVEAYAEVPRKDFIL